MKLCIVNEEWLEQAIYMYALDYYVVTPGTISQSSIVSMYASWAEGTIIQVTCFIWFYLASK